MKKLFVFFILALSVIFVTGCTDHGDHGKEAIKHEDGNQHEGHHSSSEVITSGLLHLNTKNVTRLNSTNSLEISIMTSQMIWPATHEANQPGTIMLAPVENWQLALASLNLVHHPNDGPLLFTKGGEISEVIVAEIERLQPKGNVNGTQIMVLGTLNEGEIEKLNQYVVDTIEEDEPALFAAEIDKLYSELTNNIPTSVIIGSMEEKAKLFSIPAGSWITHMDEPILYVSEREVPEATIAALQKRNGQANIYVVGPEQIISNDVLQQLEQYGNVIRIDGETPELVSIAFAKYRDPKTNFGWEVVGPGHGLVMVSTETPELAITAAPFAHLGKHAPMVWLTDGNFSEDMHNYLAELKPTFDYEPTEGPYNHAYLIGGEELVSFRIQGYIDEMLEIVPAHGGGHHGHGSHSH
ncbi:cell wall-binding repeat-containing protein [Anaerobacillus alkaliphilus]|uniref:Cell wall-binding repeat-containing protein n=1 Tax=Anaerobacillus alkaliphilus TaxID=1548597 RepID=A0A4Q0VVI4_9BACI|nr:cell wall-binding repeat-containing protein [Anaerobacillus alkaliphilus]RXJ02035.1 cell wall-binding repeat-containing protein [Anaerobacillus alkaliphilus]